jgi:hypothetical protein
MNSVISKFLIVFLISLSIRSTLAKPRGFIPKNSTRFCMFFPLSRFCMGIFAGGGKKRSSNENVKFSLGINFKTFQNNRSKASNQNSLMIDKK